MCFGALDIERPEIVSAGHQVATEIFVWMPPCGADMLGPFVEVTEHTIFCIAVPSLRGRRGGTEMYSIVNSSEV